MTDKIIVMTACGADDAGAMARALVESGVAACVNIVPGARSVYRWQGEMCESGEAVLLIKSRRDLYAALEAEIRRVHAYEVPEIVAVPVVAGSETYLNWVDGSLRASEA